MKFICLCPTFGRPSMVANAVQLFLDQKLLFGDTARLEIFDDAGQISDQHRQASHFSSWRVISQPDWIPLPSKYNAHLQILGGIHDDPDTVYVCWDDDDVYSPGHLQGIAEVLTDSPEARWAHPRFVYSTYDDRRPVRIPADEPPRIERSTGRFHGALAVRGDLLAQIGGWPQTELATYDQQMLQRLSAFSCADTLAHRHPTYCYRWQDTGKWHCSGSIDEQGRYRKPPIQEPGRVEELHPRYDESTQQILEWIS